MLASVALLIAGALLGLARRLRLAPPYALAPPRALSVGVTVVCASLLAWVVVSAGEPFVQARLETANTVSTTTTVPPGVLPVQLDGGVAWSREVPATGAIAGTVGGVAELRTDGVVMSDATTGQIRWRYARADVDDAASNGSDGLLVSSDGRTIAAHLPYDGGRAPRGIDLPTYAVLDAETGKVLTEVHTDGTALAVDANRLLVAEGEKVVAHGVSSPTHWQTQLKCTVTQGVLLADQAVVVDACGGNGAVRPRARPRGRRAALGGQPGHPVRAGGRARPVPRGSASLSQYRTPVRSPGSSGPARPAGPFTSGQWTSTRAASCGPPQCPVRRGRGSGGRPATRSWPRRTPRSSW